MKLVTLVKIGDFSEDIFITIGVFNHEHVDSAKDRVFIKYGEADQNAELSESVRIIDGIKYQLWGNLIISEIELDEFYPSILEVKI